VPFLTICQHVRFYTLHLDCSTNVHLFDINLQLNILSLTISFFTVLYGMICPQMLAVDNITKALGGKATFDINAGTLGEKFGFVGCIGEDSVRCVNACFLCLIPCITVWWRKTIREKYGIQVLKFNFYTFCINI
jgi:hypothetical protein